MERKHKREIILLAVLILLLLASLSYNRVLRKTRLYPGDVRGSIVVDGLERTFILHLPANFSEDEHLPLIIALHGGGGTGFDMERLTRGGFNELADRDRFVVVYPDGIERHWNDGRNLSRYRAQRENIDDVAFILALIDFFVNEYGVNRSRVYITGMSNGGLMAYRLACEIPERLAAVAVVGVSMSENLYGNCSSATPLPILIILGTDDPIVPWNGGKLHFGPVELGEAVSIGETVEYWAARNGCTVRHGREYLPDADPEDGTRVWVERYSNCTDGAEVVLYGVEGGGHTWPGGYQYLPRIIIGRTSRDMDASEIIWEFFKAHRRDG
ncbi:PHB depolymerase family esterase [Thermococcus sp. JdF3]|uniref:extracellular catalytic domain type 1 short-chain-length polyhydroxyalkanoate depolymerase n=1 Tax=Thermococcus sp. JdF3 TaxID=1638258 RepID=UPI0014399FBE|nr:PHB depolymerase family esterase [Thermococcus sp. JdF3]NJE00926.1 phospholipase [Thermococcus sp. JdF3]